MDAIQATEKNQKCSKGIVLIKRCIPYLWILGSFGVLDVWLRVGTRWIGAYSIYELEPNLFTLLWAVILTILVTFPKSRKVRRIAYGIVYYIFMFYAVTLYGAYLILGKFLYISDFLLAGEGADYAAYVIAFLSPKFIIQFVGLIVIGIVGILMVPDSKQNAVRERRVFKVLLVVVCIIGGRGIPSLYGEIDANSWNTWANPAYEYEHFTNPNFDLELTGMYQYILRDAEVQFERTLGVDQEAIDVITSFFDEKGNHQSNFMTGVFSGKNLIVIMMESIDDWMITEEDMPTIYQIMNNGIAFSNMYTPSYSNGYTFNTEFAFNTSVYPYSNGNVTFSMAKNTFSNSIATLFDNAGYSVASFHRGYANFYNRGDIHLAFGYESYNSYTDYSDDLFSMYSDNFLVKCDALYNDVVNNAPFYSYIITYSAHLPYEDTDELAQYALEVYPQYDVIENREINIARAKARLTDDMFAALLERLGEDGLLEDTVIVAYTDHYTYGISDAEMLQQLSENAGNSILENTPAFIYCPGYDLSMDVDKVMQITDLAPTILNLFGLVVPKEIMGQDIFDENYTGYAIFPGNTWITNTTYVKNGLVQWNDGMTEEEIAAMNIYVQQCYEVNDAILDSDYYAHID